METDDEVSKPSKWVLIGLGIVMLLVGAAIAGVFILKLQPPVVSGSACPSGDACVDMPPNATTANFAPFNVTIVIGVNNTVQWTNLDNVDHTVVICPVGGGETCAVNAAVASSAVLAHGDTYTATLGSPGTYHFFCSIHPATMRGTIVVSASA